MIEPIRSIIRGWKRIEYYSATRHRTRWGRAFDTAFVLSLLLAAPAMLVCESLIRRPVQEFWLEGEITRLDDGDVYADVTRDEPDDERGRWELPGVPIGRFEVRVIEERAGWPVVSLLDGRPPRIDLDVFIETGTRIDARLDEPADEPMRAAIDGAMRRNGHGDVIDRWHDRRSMHDERYWLGTIYGIGLWWLMLTVASAISVGVARLAWGFAADHRLTREQRLLSQGRCHVCGYDMRGLEFHERCPECGSLVK